MAEGKFGFIPEEPTKEADLALQFKPTPVSRANLAIDEVDRVAEAAGFSSRERAEASATKITRIRRALPSQPYRHVAIRMPETLFNRFVRYADKHRLTYSEAVAELLDTLGEPE